MALDDDSEDYDFPDFPEFTAADFAKIDAIIASHSSGLLDQAISDTSSADDHSTSNSKSPISADGSDTETILDDFRDGGIADVSFRSDDFDLNLSTLTAEELEALDVESPQNHKAGPSLVIEFEELEEEPTSAGNVREDDDLRKLEKPWKFNSPLDEFRSYMALSVTDLVSPSWCEVQYDYGLRGKRHRPIGQRPAKFVSSNGKTISPEATIMVENDVRTRQGLAVHKELEREIKFEELKVDITTDETRWALRIVNMLACLTGIMGGYTREMPVFGILHDEVVIGIMDEVVKESISDSPNGKKKTTSKRSSSSGTSPSSSKRARTGSSSIQTHIDAIFESPKKPGYRELSPSPKSDGYILHIKDNKTRKNRYLPRDPDMYSGRLQLMIYRRLLSELLETNPPYDFSKIWRKVDVDPTAVFPTKFLVQAQLIRTSDGFQTTCLNDLVDVWHKEIKALKIMAVDPNLELVYRLRPPPGAMDKAKGKAVARTVPPPPVISDEDLDLARAIAASLEDAARHPPRSPVVEETILPSQKADTAIESENMELQWALHDSSTKSRLSPKIKESLLPEDTADKVLDKGKGKEKDDTLEKVPKEEGIRRFKIIGTKQFLHDDEELDLYLDHVLKWWRGERKPEGVPLERVYRCSTCEYVNDCEWRAQKALELSKMKSKLSGS